MQPLIHIPAYVPYTTPRESWTDVRLNVLENVLVCLHSLFEAGVHDLLVTTNDDGLLAPLARYRASFKHRFEILRVTPADTLSTFRCAPARLLAEPCAKFVFPKLFPMFQRLAPWIVHLDFDTVVRSTPDFASFLAAGVSIVDANQFAAWRPWAPGPHVSAFFGLRGRPPATWKWLNAGIYSVTGSGFDLCRAAFGHFLAHLEAAEAAGFAKDGDELVVNALAVRDPGVVKVLPDYRDNLLAYYLDQVPGWRREARIVHFHALKPRMFSYEDGRVNLCCAPNAVKQVSLDFYLAVLDWCRHLHVATGALGLELPMVQRMPADLVERETRRVCDVLERRRDPVSA